MKKVTTSYNGDNSNLNIFSEHTKCHKKKIEGTDNRKEES